MTSIHGNAAVERHAVTEAVVDASEALCFARDLGGSLTHVLVAATGRALAACAAVGGRPPGVVVLAVTSPGQPARLVPVPGAHAAPLPQLRDAVDAALCDPDAAVEPLPTSRAVVVVGPETGSPPRLETVLRGAAGVLEVAHADGDPLSLALSHHVDRAALGPDVADELLTRIVRLLARPYRRLA